MSNLSEIVKQIPRSTWEESQKTTADMTWRTWWHLKLYANSQESGNGFQKQQVLNRPEQEVPYGRDLFFQSEYGRFAPSSQKVAYFGSDLITATCETMGRFREQTDLEAGPVLDYFQGSDDWNSTEEFGYSLEFNLDSSVKVVDFRNSNKKLLGLIAQAGPWEDSQDFKKRIISSRDQAAAVQTQVIASRIFELGFHGIWYTSVRTPPGTTVSSGDCLVLFEGAENLVRHIA